MDITYVGKSDGDYFELFHLLADGDRPVLEILVDPMNQIWVAGTTGLSVPQLLEDSDIIVHRHIDSEFESIGIDTEHVCIGSIMACVLPRAADLLARVYCPTSRQVRKSN